MKDEGHSPEEFMMIPGSGGSRFIINLTVLIQIAVGIIKIRHCIGKIADDPRRRMEDLLQRS